MMLLIVFVISDSRDNPIDIPAVSAKASPFPLSQEECGLELIIQEESKRSDNPVQLDLEKVNVFW